MLSELSVLSTPGMLSTMHHPASQTDLHMLIQDSTILIREAVLSWLHVHVLSTGLIFGYNMQRAISAPCECRGWYRLSLNTY